MTTVHLIRTLQYMVRNAEKAQRQIKGSDTDMFAHVAAARIRAEFALRIAKAEREAGPRARKVYRNKYRGPL